MTKIKQCIDYFCTAHYGHYPRWTNTGTFSFYVVLAVLYKSYDLLDCHYVYILTDMLNFTIVVSISCGIAGYIVVAMKWRSEDDNGST